MIPASNGARAVRRHTAVPVAIACAALLALGACGIKEKPQRQLSERERDSLIARSALPGASVVGSALTLQDSMAVRSGRASEWTPPADETAGDVSPSENP
jgi:hypothetical protein